ncbi:myosin light chain kinase, smooth muscle-like [Garra rufa]|uniref:myosin light chain kinase, smooth muscle-like n=1 Tax=Garra rufa TaxID=137080 RepID=UPI003CCE9085
MEFIEKGQKKTYTSTFRFDLKSSGALQTPLDVQRTENATKLTNGEESCLKSGKSETADTRKKSPKKSLDTEKRRQDITLHKTASSSSGAVVEFLDPQQQVVVGVGGTARLHCHFTSFGPVASCWIHDSEKVVLEGPRVCVMNTSSTSTLVLSEVAPVDAGSYSLFVHNRGGTAHWTVNLFVIDPPDPPASCPFVSQLTNTSLVLSWSGPCFDGGSAITGYVVEFQRLDQSEPSGWTELTNLCQNTSFRVRSGLDPLGQYRFRVRACNAAGVSDPSEESDCIKMNTTGEPQQEVTSYVEVEPDTTHKVRDHYQVHEKLGVGKFGEVFRMTHKQTGRVCAGKFYRARVSREKTAARQEIKLMNELHHPKLVQCLAAYDTPSEIVMILEYIAGGELFERIVDENFEHTEPNSVNYMRQILEGIQYIHSKHIVHLDLKPENIVCVNGAGTLIKIIDFGLACRLGRGELYSAPRNTPTLPARSASVPLFQQQERHITRLSCKKALAHPWIALFDDSNSKSTKSLNKDKMRRFLARQKWKKTGKALLALKRMVRSSKSDALHSPLISVDASALGKEAEQAVASLEKQLWIEPRFHQALRDLTESCGATVHLACVIQGYPDPEVVWLFDEAPLEKTGRIQMNYDKNGTCTLTLAQVQPGDSGIYKCCASNSLGQALCSARLTVRL